MQRTLELFSGNFSWFGALGYELAAGNGLPASWKEMEESIRSIRDEFIAGEWAEVEFMYGPSMARDDVFDHDDVPEATQNRCATLPWGDEEWARVDDFYGEEPPFEGEEKLRDAFAELAFMFRDYVEDYVFSNSELERILF